MAITRTEAVPELGKVGVYRVYRSKRVVSNMSPEERAEALSPSGVAISRLSGPAISERENELDYQQYQAQYHPELSSLFDEALLSRGSVHLDPNSSPNPDLPYWPNTLSVVGEHGESLWQVSPAR